MHFFIELGRHCVANFNKVRRIFYMADCKACYSKGSVINKSIDRKLWTFHVFFYNRITGAAALYGDFHSRHELFFVSYHAAAARAHIVHGFYYERKAHFLEHFIEKAFIYIFLTYSYKGRRRNISIGKTLAHNGFYACVDGGLVAVSR